MLARERELLEVKQLVINIRMQMPRLGTRKLYHLIQGDLERLNIKLGRDALFDYLRRENLLIYPKKNYIKNNTFKTLAKKTPQLAEGKTNTSSRTGFCKRYYLCQKQGAYTLFISGNRCL